MSTLTWLHISDLHFRASQSYDSNIMLSALLEDVKERISDDGLQPDLIAVTGDVAFAGKAKEYDMARQFFDRLLDITGLGKDRLFLVPGNHDVDRRAISPLVAGGTSILNSRRTVNQFLDNDSERALVFHRFRNYQSFVNEYLKGYIPFDSTNYFYVKHQEIAEQRVAILGLNSAWLSGSDADQYNLLLGERQVRTALEMSAGADLRLALLHHPFNWLKDFDRADVAPLLLRGCGFVLHGHLHQASSLDTASSEAMIIAAGAGDETRAYPNTYNFVQLDFSAREGNIYLRMYSDRQGGFWTRDILSYRNVSEGIYTFSLHQPLSVLPDSRLTLEYILLPDRVSVKELHLRNFRCFERERFPLSSDFTVFIGNNTQCEMLEERGIVCPGEAQIQAETASTDTAP